MRAGRTQVFSRRLVLTLICLAATSAWSRVLLRWSQPSIPPSVTLGINELVIPWDAAALIKTVCGQGYLVYAEVQVGKAADMVRSTGKGDLTGIVLNPGDAQPSQIDEALGQLRSGYPGLPVLVLNPKAKQPQMKGQLVIKRDGILQVTSPTAQPWVDTNLALVRLDQAFRQAQTPLYEFQWELSDSVQQERGPDTADYELAVAEAGAFGVDVILDPTPKLQTGLVQKDPAAWAVLNQIKRYLEFSARGNRNVGQAEANVGVIVDSYQQAYEPINLFARHNIPFAALQASDLQPQTVAGFDLLVVFAAPDGPISTAISDFASKGGIAVVVGAHGSYPWQAGQPIPAGEHSSAYAVGQGRIIELPGPVIDPETFAQDIRRLLAQDRDKISISLWNALTVIAVSYGSGRERVVELVNYSQEPIPVQIRVKGSFSSVRYEMPERACCESLAPVQRGAFTEFVVPALGIAGRVHLSNQNTPTP
jgi:hypothetical protein